MLKRLRAGHPELVLFEQRARAEQIVEVLIRYGVADMSDDADEHHLLGELARHAKPDPDLVHLSRGERLCAAAQELGTTFIKIGQILSTRADLVGSDIAKALKALQGMIWRDGYERGDYRAHFYADAAESLRHWHADGHPLYVYSSGSVPAQKLFFGYSECGDLTPLVSGWFDTEVGHKRDADAYRRITDAIGRAPGDILFLSDVVEELDAAREAGLRTALLDRRGDYPQPREGDDCHGHARFESFADIRT